MIRLAAIALLATATAASAATLLLPGGIAAPEASFIQVKSNRPIDKSCLMICKRWGDDDCLEWKMVCKGDADYPKGVMLDRLN